MPDEFAGPVDPVAVTADQVIAMARRLHVRLGCAESLTGGLVAARLVEVPGASDVLWGAVVSYATAVKIDMLGVDTALIARHGVVSAECAEAMAQGAARVLDVDIAVSTTGVAGPTSQDGKPVGRVYIAVARRPTAARGAAPVWSTSVDEFDFAGGRQEIREATVDRALAGFARCLTQAREDLTRH